MDMQKILKKAQILKYVAGQAPSESANSGGVYNVATVDGDLLFYDASGAEIALAPKSEYIRADALNIAENTNMKTNDFPVKTDIDSTLVAVSARALDGLVSLDEQTTPSSLRVAELLKISANSNFSTAAINLHEQTQALNLHQMQNLEKLGAKAYIIQESDGNRTLFGLTTDTPENSIRSYGFVNNKEYNKYKVSKAELETIILNDGYADNFRLDDGQQTEVYVSYSEYLEKGLYDTYRESLSTTLNANPEAANGKKVLEDCTQNELRELAAINNYREASGK